MNMAILHTEKCYSPCDSELLAEY